MSEQRVDTEESHLGLSDNEYLTLKTISNINLPHSSIVHRSPGG